MFRCRLLVSVFLEMCKELNWILPVANWTDLTHTYFYKVPHIMYSNLRTKKRDDVQRTPHDTTRSGDRSGQLYKTISKALSIARSIAASVTVQW